MMNKRDLLADVKFCDRATQGPWRHDEWNLDCSEVYAPEVDNPIILVGHDPYDADFIVQAREGWPHAIERAIEAEALARELAEVLLLYEKWEADLLMDNSLWQSASGLPFITQEVWDELVAVQTERNKVLHKVKEVLGDE
jgi:hypothetical protein